MNALRAPLTAFATKYCYSEVRGEPGVFLLQS